jgi:hypothetical protein
MSFCDYKYSLGKPNEGLHTHFFGFAVGDLILTVILSFVIMLYIKDNFKEISHSLLFGIILIVLLLIGEYLHKIVCLK